MQVYIAGSGKLAAELLGQLPRSLACAVQAWGEPPTSNERAIVVHAGSGRELPAIQAYCHRTQSVLLELATGSALEGADAGFPVVICPNTNILMLKFMSMLARCGGLFQGYGIRITESHQASKTSVPGTAVAMARSLGVPADHIVSVRNPADQAQALQIPPAHLARHAFHRIDIVDGEGRVSLETSLVGDAPYALGVQQIIQASLVHALQPRTYAINEFIDNGWV